jgi:hypothetical protein
MDGLRDYARVFGMMGVRESYRQSLGWFQIICFRLSWSSKQRCWKLRRETRWITQESHQAQLSFNATLPKCHKLAIKSPDSTDPKILVTTLVWNRKPSFVPLLLMPLVIDLLSNNLCNRFCYNFAFKRNLQKRLVHQLCAAKRLKLIYYL